METSNKFFSGFAPTRVRLAMVAAALAAATCVFVSPAVAADIAFDLYAVTGTAAVRNSVGSPPTLPVWGYASTDTPVTQPGGITLFATVGDAVTITLHNSLPARTSLLFQGQEMVPDTTGVAPGAAKTYTFTAGKPGTYLYEAGLLSGSQYQAAMGLHGALVVRPVTVGQAYVDNSSTVIDEGALTAYDEESTLVLSEIDPALNSSADPAAFDMRNFSPMYYLINGQSYPDTLAIPTVPGHKLLLRYVNAGMQHHSMAVLGMRQNFVAKDGSLLPTLTHNVAAETLAPGQTGDAIVVVPATAAATNKFAVYDGSLKLYNDGNGSAFGGMMTFVSASGTGGGAPTTTGLLVAPNPSNGSGFVALSAAVGSASGSVTGVEYFVDTSGTDGSGTSMTLSASSSRYVANVPVGPLLEGPHTLYVHGQNSTGWGVASSATLTIDKTGPVTSALTISLPQPVKQTDAVTLGALSTDNLSNIVAAEYTIDGGSPVAMTVGGATGTVRSLSAYIPPGLAVGSRTLAVRSQDAAGNWGSSLSGTLVVAAVAPVTTTNVVAQKTPNNGTVPFSPSQPVVRVTAKFDTSGTTVGGAEGFIDSATPATTVRGFPFVAGDGAWNGAMELGYADIPLATVNALSNGNHIIYVRGKDATGVWGPLVASNPPLVIDKIAPTLTTISVAPNIAFGTVSTALSMVASDASGIQGGQYWFDGSATTPPANATAFSGTSAMLITGALTGGQHNVRVRVQDNATNWSTVRSAALYVVQAVADSKTFNASGAANTQTQNYNSNNLSLLANDFPTSGTVALVSAPVRISGTGTGTMSLTCTSGTSTSFGGSSICTNGRFTVNLPNTTGSNSNSAAAQNARQAARRGTYTFTYQTTSGGVTSGSATVTITVQ